MIAGDWLLVRRQGSLWGVPREQVQGIRLAQGGEIRLASGSRTLIVDEVLGLEGGASVRPAGPLVRWATLASCQGLAATGAGPALVIDPIDPPSELSAEDEGCC